MKLKWYGHSCFSMAFDGGATVVTDPFDESVGYPLCRAHADIALSSHDHFDHNHTQSLGGSPTVIRDGAPRDLLGLRIYGVDSFHDDDGGRKRGNNVMFVVEGEGLRIAHLGDLGHFPDKAQISALGKPDILLVPIGGTYTISTEEAVRLIDALKPRTAVAMHFKTALCDFPITDEREFVRLTGAKYLPNEIEIAHEALEALPSAAVLACPPAR